MSLFTDAFTDLYDVQTECVGAALVATIGTVAVSKPAIISEADVTMEIDEGGIGTEGGYSIQMLISDFTGEPVRNSNITATGPALGRALQVHSFTVNHGVYSIMAQDVALMG